MNEIILHHKPESDRNIVVILGNIEDDIFQWENLHGERPGRICLSNILYEAISHWSGMARCYETTELVCEPMLYGIPVFRYTPSPKDGPMAVAYYLAGPERKFSFKED